MLRGIFSYPYFISFPHLEIICSYSLVTYWNIKNWWDRNQFWFIYHSLSQWSLYGIVRDLRTGSAWWAILVSCLTVVRLSHWTKLRNHTALFTTGSHSTTARELVFRWSWLWGYRAERQRMTGCLVTLLGWWIDQLWGIPHSAFPVIGCSKFPLLFKPFWVGFSVRCNWRHSLNKFFLSK